MQEQTIPKPLGGAEIRKAIITKISSTLETAMKKDCFLLDHLAYAVFEARVDFKIEIKFPASDTRVKGTGLATSDVVAQGELPGEVGSRVSTGVVEMEPKPPNEVRQETGQGIPVISQTPQGRIEEKRVKYAPKVKGEGKKRA